MKHFPLVVDLDGTLHRSDLLFESCFLFAKTSPLCALAPFVWLTSGKAHLKEQLAKTTRIEVETLPYDPQVISLIKEEKAKGRQIILATASHKIYADQIAKHLDLFDRVMATEGKKNLSAGVKRDRLISEFGKQGFDYVGNSHADLPVWAAARRAYVVNPDSGVEAKAKAFGNVARVIQTPQNPIKKWAKALRLHQWTKNLLIFVPLMASHQLSNGSLLLDSLLAFFFFGLCASSVYLLNDLLDLSSDRQHPRKRHRPFASGALSIKAGIFAFPILLGTAFIGAISFLPWQFTEALAIYFALTTAYSFVLKGVMMLDVIILALLYTIRIIAGTLVFGLTLTFWMLAFSMFIFLSLALIKRYAELLEARNKGKSEKTHGRAYYPNDLEMISALGAASGYLSVMVLALYIQDETTKALYEYPQVIWLACPLLMFWISRAWLLTHRGEMHDDPVVFAIKDRVSLLVGCLFGIIFWLAT